MPKQVDKYDNERQNVLNKIFDILGINQTNNKFLLHDLDNDLEKQNKILELKPDIKKYFVCSSWTCFKREDGIKRKVLSIIKNLVKDMGYIAQTSRKIIKNDDNTTSSITIYKIFKNTI